MPSQTWVEPVILEGTRVRLEPLRRDHLADLKLVAFDAPLWQWTIMGPQDEAGLERWLETALANAEAGAERPFATIDLASGRAVGSSRYMSIAPEHRRLEIGWTWIGSAFQRTGANREAKLLQLTHAFETLGSSGTADPQRLSANISEVLLATVIGLGLSLIGLVLICIALFASRYRAPWFFWFLVIYGAILLYGFPVGTVIGTIILVYCFTSRAQFLRRNESERNA